MEYNALQESKRIIIQYKFFFISWAIVMSFLYWDNLTHYPNSVIEKYCMRELYSYFDYVHDYEREKEALRWAKENGTYLEAKMWLDIGLEFTKPIPNFSKFFWLLCVPVTYLLIILQTIALFFRVKSYFPKQK